MLSQTPIINNIRNSIITNKKAMPQKDTTSDGTSSFSMGRNAYIEWQNEITNNLAVQKQKKWYGNRDAYSVINKNRNKGIGAGSINANLQPLAFTAKHDNSVNNALTRVRAGGPTVPPKCNHAKKLQLRFI